MSSSNRDRCRGIDLDILEWLKELEHDLKWKNGRTDALDILNELAHSDDLDIRRKAVWCTAKMGQNKVNDDRIIQILIPLHADPDPEVRENVAWGIGETSGTGVTDDRSCDVLSTLLSDEDVMVRGMAAWAAGRIIHKLNLKDEFLIESLRKLSDDGSNYVRNAVIFALDGL